MFRIAKKWFLASMVLFIIVAALAVDGVPLPQSEPVQGPIRPLTQASAISYLKARIEERMEASKIPGLAIALVDGDKVIWAEGFGHTERDGEQKVTPDTLFSMQSISKHFTTLGFLRAVDKGLVQLDEHLTAVTPEFKVHSRMGDAEAATMTFRQLLSHWSGLPHEALVGNNYDFRNTSFDDHIRSISDTWLKFPVGEHFSYSNLGVDMVGYALQIRTGKSFASYMKDEVFKPLGMNASTFDLQQAWQNPSVAKGHAGIGKGTLPYVSMVPSGGMYTSVNDVARCLMMELNGGQVDRRRFISEKLQTEMYTPQFAVPGQRFGYGLGTASGPWYGVTAYNHGGGGFGYITIMKWIPEYKIGVVILSNAINNDVRQLADQALVLEQEVKTGSAPQRPLGSTVGKPAVTLDESVLRNLQGTYRGRSLMASFEVRDGSLCLDYIGGKSTKLRAVGATEFSDDSSEDNNTWTFQLDASGKPKGVLMLGDRGAEYLPLNDQPNENRGPDRAEWKAWTGVYAESVIGAVWQPASRAYVTTVIGPEFKIEVAVRNGYLYLIDGESALKLTEWKSDLFFTSVGDSVQFQPGRAIIGNVAYLRK